jgi:putative membrane protein
MSTSQPQRLFGTTNELAKERNRAAAQRTLNAWIGNCLSLIGIGVAGEQIAHSLQYRFPDSDPVTLELTAKMVGLVLVGVGIGLLAFALIQHHLEIKTIEREDYVLSSVHALNRVAVVAIVVLGLAGFFTILFLL